VALTIVGCTQTPTTLLLEVNGPATLTSMDVSVGIEGTTISKHLSLATMPLPGKLIVLVPDRAVDVMLDVVGHGPDGDLSAHTVVRSQPHAEVLVPITLGGEVGELGAVDLGHADLAMPTHDLAHEDLAPRPTPVPRLIATADYSSAGSTAGMSASGFSISTAGVVNGDLLLFIANVDNGDNNNWPNPIATGWHQLAQHRFGSDGQTYVIDYKIANNEPATVAGSYGVGIGSSAAVIALIAVSGADQTNPINAFLANDGNTTSSMPTVATSPGVTTTVSNCLIVYAAGADWLGFGSSNTFSLPAGMSSLMAMGDHGNNMWDWTSQMVGWTAQLNPGATGSFTGTLTSSTPGIPWTAVIAVAP
jgi:hypothetical protein